MENLYRINVLLGMLTLKVISAGLASQMLLGLDHHQSVHVGVYNVYSHYI